MCVCGGERMLGCGEEFYLISLLFTKNKPLEDCYSIIAITLSIPIIICCCFYVLFYRQTN